MPMKASFPKGSKEFSWFTDFWKIVQTFWIPEKDNHDYWTHLVDTAGKFCDKYKSDQKLWHFSLKLMTAYAEFLDEQARGDIPGRKK